MQISQHTRLAVVLGDPISHSLSPAMHNAAFAATGLDAVYLALSVSAEDLSGTLARLRATKILGASVTVPHKGAIVPLCTSLSEAASAIGAVNTLELRDGDFIGHNTDADGFIRGLRAAYQLELEGSKAVLLGGGGAARAVTHGLSRAGARVEVIARRPTMIHWTQAHPWTSDELRTRTKDCDLLVDCTSAGLSPEQEGLLPAPIPLNLMPQSAIICSLIYHRQPALLSEARARGMRTHNGINMLLFQGAIAFEIWTGLRAPVEAMRSALMARIA